MKHYTDLTRFSHVYCRGGTRRALTYSVEGQDSHFIVHRHNEILEKYTILFKWYRLLLIVWELELAVLDIIAYNLAVPRVPFRLLDNKKSSVGTHVT